MTSPIMRAGMHGLASHKYTAPSRSRVAEIGKKNFTCADDDDDDGPSGGSEGYSIDPSVQLWKSIDFGRTKSRLDLKEEVASNSSSNASFRANYMAKSLEPESLSVKSPRMSHMSDPSQTILSSEKSSKNKSAAIDDDVESLKKRLAAHYRQSSKSLNSSESGKDDGSQLDAQREELRQMMEAVKREKEELALKSQLQEAEQLKRKFDEEKTAEKEREDLKVMLEVMKMQNQMLVNRMAKSELEAQQMLVSERTERKLVIQRMETENKLLNQKILEAQARSESELAAEKDLLRKALKQMEHEKASLMQRVRSTEEQAKSEIILAELQKAEFMKNLDKLERDKQELMSQVTENENKMKLASDAMTGQLLKEKDDLALKMKRMEVEKDQLVTTLSSTVTKAQEQSEILAKQLDEERQRLQESVARMEKDKHDMASHLAITEQQAHERAAAVSQQLEKEKLEFTSALGRMEKEKHELAEKLQQNAQQVEQASVSAAETLAEERRQLQERLEAMALDKSILEEKLRNAESLTIESEKLVTERIAKERDELKLTVQRMIEENKRVVAADNASALALLKPTKSLFDMMEDGGGSGGDSAGDFTKKTSKRSMLTHKIQMIREEVEVDNDIEVDGEEGEQSFMDLSSDDEDNKKAQTDEPDPFADLPAPHAAAARGDIARLQMLASFEVALLSSFDSAHRSPLFYAVAYSQNETAEYLVGVCKDMADELDAHGDSPLHAAISAGNTFCVDLLLQATDGKASIKNHMDMTPAHLSSSVECLMMLYKHGADMAALDCNGRSPLFVACAMNRLEIAEYLINCLDEDETSLLIQDNRGDTPLHAAACNGSVDCLLLLLQYGIDPSILNAKGLRAIDLAVKNKQKKCRELLSEYHLHYCTSSSFDSVLFLATLEGHKQVKQGMLQMSQARTEQEDTYQIIKKSVNEPKEPDSPSTLAPSSSAFGVMNRTQSLFSLKTNKSLRLQRWGAWIAYEDQVTNSVYWYNHETSVGQWEKPESVTKMQQNQGNVDKSSNSSDRYLVSKMSMRLKRLGDWIQYITEAGQTFYYNEKNGEFQWSNPELDPQGASKPEDCEWKPYKDPETGSIFWYNHVTNVSQWECPLQNSQEAVGQSSVQCSARGGGEDGDDPMEGLIQVDNNDDLGI